MRSPQSSQSVPHVQILHSLPAPPSSHTSSLASLQVLRHGATFVPGGYGGGDGEGGGDGDVIATVTPYEAVHWEPFQTSQLEAPYGQSSKLLETDCTYAILLW